MSIILTIVAVIFLVYIFISFREVRDSNNNFEFIYPWAFWVGAFVWEDLLVFSLLHLIFVVLTFLFHDFRVGLLMISIFWLVRSMGETLYFFLQQYHEPKGEPHGLQDHFDSFGPILGNISLQKGYILMQIIHQSVAVLSLSSIILLVINWKNIIQWF